VQHHSADHSDNTVGILFHEVMAYYNPNERSLNVLWETVNCERQLFAPMPMDKNVFRGAPAIDIYTAANIGDCDVIYHVLNG
jgi:hypothetical protein